MRTRQFFIATAVIEAATGLALLIAPAALVALLIGANVDTAGGIVVARVAAIAMLSIAISCWMVRNERGEGSRGLLVGLLVYNSAIVLLLIHAAVSSHLSAIGLWPTVGMHAAFAIWGATSLAR